MKLFNKFVSIVTVVAFVLSMMAVPAFAAGVEGVQTATGNEKIVVTYYKDAAMSEAVTEITPDVEKVYAKVSANIPTGTLQALDVDLKVAGATIEAETNADMFSATLANWERPAIAGTAYNIVKADKSGVNIFISIKQGVAHDSPTDVDNWNGLTEYTNVGVTSFDIALYELAIADGAEEVSMSINGGVGLSIGAFDEDAWAFVASPCTVEGTLAIEEAAAPDVITTRYEITKRPSEFIDPELSEAEMIEAIKAQVEVTKYTTTNGVADAGVVVTDQCTFSDFNFETRQALVTYPVDALNTSATSNSIGWEFMVLEYSNETVTIASEFEYAMTEEEIAETAEVTARKRKGTTYSDYTLVEDEDYTITVTFDTDANSGTWAVEYIGRFAGNAAANGTFTRTNAPVSYKDVVASISGSPFAFGTTEDEIKVAIAVKGTKVEGVVETADVTVPADLYEITVDLAAGTAVVTMDGTTIDTLTFDISEETFTYSDYAVDYTGEDEYDYTVDADTIAALVKVTATKTGESTPAETVDLTNEVDVVVDKDAGTITVTWKAGSAHAAETIDGAVINVTFNDVIEYKNVSATMSKTSFAEGTDEDDILAFLTVSVEKWVNGEKEDGFVADYMATVVGDKVVVEFDDEYGVEDIEIDITFYSSDAVVLKVVGGEGVTAGEVEEEDGEFKAIVKVEGLDTRVLSDADLAISASAGVLEEVAVVTGSGYNVLPGAAIAGNVWTGTIYKGIEAVDLTNGLLVVTVNTDGLADGTVIEVKVDSATLRMVDDTNLVDPFVEIPNTTEALEVEVNAFVRNVEDVTLNDVEIDIVTLGPVTDAKFVDGVSLVDANDVEIDLTGKVTLNGTNRSIIIDDVALAVSDTENVVKYTLKVEVAGYTAIESEIVVSYNGVATNDWTVTNTLADAKIYAADVTGDDNTIAADDYSDVVAMYNQTAAFDIYEGNGININDISTTVYMYDNYGMRLVNKATGVIAD